MSIRLRLTLLYSAILALTLTLFSAGLYLAQAQSTLNILKNDLAVTAEGVALGWSRARRDWDRSRQLPRMELKENPATDSAWPGMMLPQELSRLRGRDTMRMLDRTGSPLNLPMNEESTALPISEKGLKQIQSGQAWVEIAPSADGRLLIYNQPLEYNGQIVGIVQVARLLTDRDRSLEKLGLTLILGSLLTTVVAFGVGWALAGVTLRPIHRLTQTAMEIGETRDFSSRVQHRGPNDELGQLARTFNGMLSRLQDAYQQVAHALQVQRDFVADVSHELRTPLTTIRGNLALLRRQPPLPAAEQEDVLQDLIGESERLIRLVNDLLTLARADAGRKLNRQPVAMRPLVNDVCRQAQMLEPQRQIECTVSEDAVALADSDALKQVLLILLDNALKHAQGPIRLALQASDHQVRVSVQDNGPGMSPELCARIFDRFYRGDASRSTPGFGLGLSIAKALIEAQEGIIQVESQIGKGSTFTVTIPQA